MPGPPPSSPSPAAADHPPPTGASAPDAHRPPPPSFPTPRSSRQTRRNREASDATLDAHLPASAYASSHPRSASQSAATAAAGTGVGSPDSIRTELAAFGPSSPRRYSAGHGRSGSSSIVAVAFPSGSTTTGGRAGAAEEEQLEHERDWTDLQREIIHLPREGRDALCVDVFQPAVTQPAAAAFSAQDGRRRSISPTDERDDDDAGRGKVGEQEQQYARHPSTSVSASSSSGGGGTVGDTTLATTTSRGEAEGIAPSPSENAASPNTGQTYTFGIHQQLRAQERLQQRQRERQEPGGEKEGARGEEEEETPLTTSLGSFAASAGGAIAGFFGGLGRSASLSLRGGAPLLPQSATTTTEAEEEEETKKMIEMLPEGRMARIGPTAGHRYHPHVIGAKAYQAAATGQHGPRGASNQISSASTARGEPGETRTQPTRKKTIAPPELLVIVRPPPSKQVHPLNLQVQLVTPQGPAPPSVGSTGGAKTTSGGGGSLNPRPSADQMRRASIDSRRDSSVIVFPDDDASPSAGAGGQEMVSGGAGHRRVSTEGGRRSMSNVSSGDAAGALNRSQSTSSNTSDFSGAAAPPVSSSSHTRAASTTTTGGGGLHSARSLFSSWQQQRTRITPLYNLGFHSLLPTTIVDAGTEQKVAKVSKKGMIELEGFGTLEPRVLVIGVNDMATRQRAELGAALADGGGSGGGAAGGSAPLAAGAAGIRQPPKRTATLETNTSGMSSSLGGAASSSGGVSSAAGVEPHPLAPGGALSEQEPPTSFQAMTADAKAPAPTATTGAGAQEEDKIGKKLLRGFKRLSLGPGLKNKDQPASSPAGSSILSPAASMFSRVGRGSMDAGGGGGAASSSGAAGGALAGMEGILAAKTATGMEMPPMTPIERKPGQKRAEGYIWTVRKWARKIDEAEASKSPQRAPVPTESAQVQRLDGKGAGQNEILSKVWKRFNLVNRVGGAEIHPDVSDIPVRFEWTLDTHRVHRRRAIEEARAAAQAGLVGLPPTGAAAAAGSRASLHGAGGLTRSASRRSSTTNANAPNLGHRRPSHASSVSGSEAAAAAAAAAAPPRSPAGGAVRALDSASASCASSFSEEAADRSRDDASSVGVRSGANALDEEDSDPEDSERLWTCHLVLGPQTKIPIATLVPAPHHPSIVGQLAIPFPLPDLKTSGLGQDGAGLTREELKDIIIVTVLHLVVRESFGGLGKKKPKK